MSTEKRYWHISYAGTATGSYYGTRRGAIQAAVKRLGSNRRDLIDIRSGPGGSAGSKLGWVKVRP